jgi:hypothetical protein
MDDKRIFGNKGSKDSPERSKKLIGYIKNNGDIFLLGTNMIN